MTEHASLLDRAPEQRPRSTLVSAAGAMIVHGGLVALALVIGTRVVREVAKAPAISEMVEIEVPAPEVPPAAPAEAARIAPAPKLTHAEPKAAPAPAAAQAGQVLDAAHDVVDFDSFVVGKGESYAGGVTETNGTGENAVRDSGARAGGVPGGSGTPPPVLVDRSRPPSLAGGVSWDCPFPDEADEAGVDHARVALRIQVGADGRVLNVITSNDPGHGFGREARRCAHSKRWSPGLDTNGTPTTTTTVVNVRFDR